MAAAREEQVETNELLVELGRLAELRARAGSLWPSSPGTIDAAAAWVEEAREYAERTRLRWFRPEAVPLGRARSRSPGSGGESSAEMLGLLRQRLDVFEDPDPARGVVARIERRLWLAPTKDEYSESWEWAIASIASIEECPVYRGLRLEVHDGLYPVGRAPESGLWEFVCLEAGGPPGRDAGGRLMITPETGPVLVLLPPGTFRMGAEHPGPVPRGDNLPEYDPRVEGPVHDVTLSAFFIGKWEVRQCEWRQVTGESPSRHLGDDLPVDSVIWRRARAFSERLGLRLPTEAQWEYACRAGTSTPFAGTGYVDDMGWYRYNSGMAPHPVGEQCPNAFGLHDLHGNIAEWCEDVWDPEFYSKAASRVLDPVCREGAQGTEGAGRHVVRGGAWSNLRPFTRASARGGLADGSRYSSLLGVRLAGPARTRD